MKNLITLFSFALCLLFTNATYAVVGPSAPVNAENIEVKKDVSPQKLTKKELRKQKRLNKRMAKIQEKLEGVDLSDPIDKWMWFWIFGWGAGLILSIVAAASVFSLGFGLFWLLATLCWLFGTVALVIWLVKKFA